MRIIPYYITKVFPLFLRCYLNVYPIIYWLLQNFIFPDAGSTRYFRMCLSVDTHFRLNSEMRLNSL